MSKSSWGILAPLCAFLCFLPFAQAKSPSESQLRTKARAAKVEAETVDLFDAITSGDVEVKVIPKDEASGKVLIENKTKRPLAIRLPEAFVAVPVAAQFGGPGFGAPGGNRIGGDFIGNQTGQMGGQNQPIGGGFNPGGGGNGQQVNGNGNGNFNGGIFKVEPEKVGRLKFTTVCLAHGKPNPNPHIPYELVPLETFTSNTKAIEAIKMLASGNIDQKSAQALAWHFENGKSWSELTELVGARHLTGRTEGFFTSAQLAKAKKLADELANRASANYRTVEQKTAYYSPSR